MTFTQDFRTQRRNYSDSNTRVGEKDRLWYNSETNTIRISDGVTPGGLELSSAEGPVGADGIQGEPGIQGASAPETNNSFRIEFYTDDIIYKGEAAPGSIETDAVWRISKIEFDAAGDVSITWAEGNADYDKSWSDRLEYQYR